MIAIRQMASKVRPCTPPMPLAVHSPCRPCTPLTALLDSCPARQIKKMPIAPVLILMRNVVAMLLRVRRANISTSTDGDETTPFRGYSSDFSAPTSWTGGGKSLLLELFGASCINGAAAELHRLEPGEKDVAPALAEALAYMNFEDGEMIDFKEGGTAAFVGNLLKEHPRIFHPKIVIPEGDEWMSTIEMGKSPAEVGMWTKFWDAFAKLAKGTGQIDVARSKFVMMMLIMFQPDVLARLAALENKKKNGLFGRMDPLPFAKDAFDFSGILDATYDGMLCEQFKSNHRAILRSGLAPENMALLRLGRGFPGT